MRKKYEYVAYHSSPFEVKDFNKEEDRELRAGSSTRIDGIFFSDVPQKSWGEKQYKVKIISEYPAIFDMSKSRFDSLSVQEAFDALLRGDVSYVKDDLIEQAEMDEDEADNLVEKWAKNTDLIVLTNVVYAKHNTEYIVPDRYYNKHRAKIVIEDVFEFGGIVGKKHLQLGSAKKLGISPIVREHDMIAECGDCGDKFSYQNSKNHILWKCPECKSIKQIY